MKNPKGIIISPSPDEVQKYLLKWDNLGNYVVQEEALDDLFMKTYPNNTDIKQVIIKVSALNDFYSTNIFKVFNVAKHIIDLNIDERLAINDVTLVNDIAKVQVSDDKCVNFYSFATKYCSRHKPTEYPIFDSFVEKLLKYFRDVDKKIMFQNDDLNDYQKYKCKVLSNKQKKDKIQNF